MHATLSPGPGPTAIDTIITDPGSESALEAGSASQQGAAARKLRIAKCDAFRKYHLQGLTLYDFAGENYGYRYRDKHCMEYIRHLATAATAPLLLVW